MTTQWRVMETQLQLVENGPGSEGLEILGGFTTTLMSFVAKERRKRGWIWSREERSREDASDHIFSRCIEGRF